MIWFYFSKSPPLPDRFVSLVKGTYLKWINFDVDKISRISLFFIYLGVLEKNCSFKNFAWTNFTKTAKIRENRENLSTRKRTSFWRIWQIQTKFPFYPMTFLMETGFKSKRQKRRNEKIQKQKNDFFYYYYLM